MPRPMIFGARVQARIPAETERELVALAELHGVTPSVILRSAVDAALRGAAKLPDSLGPVAGGPNRLARLSPATGERLRTLAAEDGVSESDAYRRLLVAGVRLLAARPELVQVPADAPPVPVHFTLALAPRDARRLDRAAAVLAVRQAVDDVLSGSA